MPEGVSVGSVAHLVQHGEDPARGAVTPARQQPHVGHVLEHLYGGARATLRQVEHLQGSHCRDPVQTFLDHSRHVRDV